MIVHEMIEKLTDERQRNAIRAFNRCVISAGPGSGKTYRLILKISYLLGQSIHSPQSIACITYMNDAVREIERRLSSLGFDDEECLFVGTVHKFCINAIILPFRDIFLPYFPTVIRIVDKDTQLEYVWQALKKIGISGSDKDAQNWLNSMNEYRVNTVLGDQKTFRSEIIEVTKYYKDILREHQQIDFNDISLESYRLITTKPQVCKFVNTRYPWLVIDEYQDLGRVFNALIIHLVTHTNINFFVVGDPNQSIMGFQGADPSYMSQLASLEGVEEISIVITRRCLPHIVEAANRLLPENTPKIKTLHPHDATRYIRSKKCDNGIAGQIQVLVDEIQKLHHQGVAYGEIAVLCRYVGVVTQIAEAFIKTGISYSGDGDGRYPRSPLTRWLEDLAGWIKEGWETSNPKFQAIYKQFNMFLRRADQPLLDPLPALQRQTVFFETLWQCRDMNMLVDQWLAFLNEKLGLNKLVEVLSDSNLEAYDAKAFWEFEKWTRVGGLGEKMTIADLALCGRSEKSVFLSTLHKSKGLEFETVIIPDLEQGRLPSWQARTELEIAEERRLFFVGITRAKKDVLFLYSGYYHLPWGGISSGGPSQFLRELRII